MFAGPAASDVASGVTSLLNGLNTFDDSASGAADEGSGAIPDKLLTGAGAVDAAGSSTGLKPFDVSFIT